MEKESISLQLLIRLFKDIPIPTFAWQAVDGDFIIIAHNDAAVDMTGGNVVSFVGLKASNMYKSSPDILADLEKCFMDKLTFGREVPYIYQSTGEKRLLKVLYNYFPPDIIMVHSTDLTGFKYAESALAESEENTRALINAITESIFLIDKDLSVLALNETAARRMGLPIEELVSKNSDFYASNVIPADVTEQRRQLIEDVFNKGVDRRVIDERNGIIFDTNYYPIFNDKNQVIHVAVFGRDITKQTNTEKALRDSETKYSEMVGLLPQTIYEMDLSGDLTFTNKHGLEIFGYTEEDLRNGVNVFDLFTDQSVSKIKKNIESRLKGEPEEDHQYTARRKDGSTFQVVSYSSPILENDKVVGLRGVLYDITERIEAEKKLEQSEEKYRLLVQNVRVGIVIMNYDGDFLFANNSSAIALGVDADKLVGMTLWDLFPKDIGKRQLENIRRVIDSGESFSEESRTFFNDKWRWYITDIQPFNHFESDNRCAMIMAYDITERKINEIRGRERLRLLNSLRFVEKTEDVLNIACTSIRDAQLFQKTSFILLSNSGKIVNMGQAGYYSDTDLDIDRKLAGIGKIDIASVPKEHRISNSLIINLDKRISARSDNKWETGSLACIPLSSESNKYGGWMILEEPFSCRMPLEDEIQFIEEVVEIVAKDIREIESLKQLQRERKALEEKNIALREVLEHIEKEKLNIKRQLAKDVDQTLIPALKRLLKPDGSVNKSYYDVLSRGLNELALSTGGLLHLYARLSPREVDICNMLKTGATSQEIANDLYITLATIKKHRQMIRRKFGLSGKKTNLESYLKQL